MANARIDRVDLLSYEEHLGAITKLTRKALVTGLDNTFGYNILDAALALDEMPKYGAGLTPAALPEFDPLRYSHLRLSTREPKLVHDNSTVEVILTYESLLSGHNQPLNGLLPVNTIFGEHRAGLVQKKTNRYKENGVGPDLPLAVFHTFPRTPGEERPGLKQSQGGEIEIMEPQLNYKFKGVYSTPFPWLVRDFFHGCINSVPWLNQPIGAWMCTEVTYHMIAIRRFVFEFEFQSNSDLWFPEIVFIDERTGRPPQGLVEGVGKRKIPYYKPVNYNLAFAAMFEGWQQILN